MAVSLSLPRPPLSRCIVFVVFHVAKVAASHVVPGKFGKGLSGVGMGVSMAFVVLSAAASHSVSGLKKVCHAQSVLEGCLF